MIESRLQTTIKNALEALGCIVIKVDPPPVGVPDLLVIYAPNQHFWLEVKTPTGRLSPPQIAYHKLLRLKHESVSVVRSKKEALAVYQQFTQLPETRDRINY